MANELTKVEHYSAENIQVLEGLEPVRKRPGMYIGSTDERGLHHLVAEIVDNSVDEAVAGYCTEISISILEDGSCRVMDNGRGIPTGIKEKEGISAAELVLTKLHAGGKFGGGGYKISGGLHGVGLSVVNALSETLLVDIFQKGEHFHQEYHRGIPTGRLEVVGKVERTGTCITFMPDEQIFNSVDFNYDTLKHRLREIAFLNKGLKINMEDKREGREQIDTFYFLGGIKEFVQELTANKGAIFSEPVYLDKVYNYNRKNEHGESVPAVCEIEVSFQYTDSYQENIHTYVNNINTDEGGKHLDGFRNAVMKVVNDYAVSNKLIKENVKMSGEDTREGIVAVVSVKVEEPQFEGQTKTKLGNEEIKTYTQKATQEEFSNYLEEHPKEGRVLINKCLLSQKAREAARNAREATRRKSVLENTALPGKLADCSEKNSKDCEIFIVEGDSAGGSAKQGRDRRFQAILPLRGKILNVEKTREAKALENEEIKSMITAFGCGINEECDPSKLRYDKIVCMTDADVDGAHIRILLLTFFFRFMRPLVEQGHIYIAQPPLYKVQRGKHATYCYSDDELARDLELNGSKGADVQRYKGLGEMDPEQLWETTMDPEKRTMLQVKMQDAIDADAIFDTLMGERPELRRQFIDDNAGLVKDLDI